MGLVVKHGYGVILFGTLSLAWVLLRSAPAFGVAKFWAVSLAIGMAVVWVWRWEKAMPFTEAWVPGRKRFRLDLAHTLFSSGTTSKTVEWALLAFAAEFSTVFLAEGVTLWPTAWPLGVQLVLALLVGEFGAYWAHRLCHLTRIGWRIHVLHHSAEMLHFLASGRTHPFNTALVFLAQSFVVILCGAPDDVIRLMAVFTGVNGLLQHANIRAEPPGWIRSVVATCVHHRWHHSQALDESNTNFGNNLILWDRVFGTCYEPSDRSPSSKVGIAGAMIPENLLSHYATPFVLQRYEREGDSIGKAD